MQACRSKSNFKVLRNDIEITKLSWFQSRQYQDLLSRGAVDSTLPSGLQAFTRTGASESYPGCGHRGRLLLLLLLLLLTANPYSDSDCASSSSFSYSHFYSYSCYSHCCCCCCCCC